MSEVDESRPVQIIKGGRRTGVKVRLLAEDGIIISGLKAEWPPWVKLEPKQNRISMSLDGKNWEDQSSAADLWFLRSLDPRTHMQQEIGGKGGPYFYMGKAQMGEVPRNVRIEGRGTQEPRVSFDFPFSGERLTLKFSPKRTAVSKRSRFNA